MVVVEKLHSTSAFVEVITKGNDTIPVLDFSGFGPKGYVERFRDWRSLRAVEIWIEFIQTEVYNVR